ncbi:MAG: hypothetical protein ACRDTM_05640 [Micromonosporaceae bacterium]
MKPTTRTIRFVTTVMAVALTAIFGVTSGASAAGSDLGTTATSTVIIGTHNTLHGNATFHDFADVIGWQEVDSTAARQKMVQQLGSGYDHYLPAEIPARAVPISWRVSKLRLLNTGFQRTHDGEAGVTPARYIVWVSLEVRETGKRFIFLNTHFISGAWNKHPERQARWLKHYTILYNKVERFRELHPEKPIFVVGDFNRHKAMPMPSPIKWVPVKDVSGVPIDQIYAPSNISHGLVARKFKWGSDHYAYRMWATF